MYEFIHTASGIYQLESFVGLLSPLSLGHREATADLLQGRGQPRAAQCVSVLPGGGHRHRTH